VAKVIQLDAHRTCKCCVAGESDDREANPVAVTCWCGSTGCLRCMDAWHWRYYDCRPRKARRCTACEESAALVNKEHLAPFHTCK
jgi:hypothetical protein